MRIAIFLLAFLAISFVAAHESPITCWGDANSAVFGSTNPVPTGDFSSIDADANGDTACGIDHNHESECWGSDGNSIITDTPSDSGDDNFVSVAVGADFACALRDDGEVVCWGGDSAFSDVTSEFGDVVLIAAGRDHACGILADDSANGGTNTICWGDSFNGGTDVPSGVNFEDLALGDDYSCGLDHSDGQITCWGVSEDSDWDGPPTADSYSADHFGAGTDTVCFIDNGNLTCFGAPHTDDGNGDSIYSPPDGDRYNNVYVGGVYACALDKSHHITCWGDDDTDLVVADAPAGRYDELAAGADFVCARSHSEGSPARRPSSVFSALLN